jgi:hypothetical protein
MERLLPQHSVVTGTVPVPRLLRTDSDRGPLAHLDHTTSKCAPPGQTPDPGRHGYARREALRRGREQVPVKSTSPAGPGCLCPASAPGPACRCQCDQCTRPVHSPQWHAELAPWTLARAGFFNLKSEGIGVSV